LLSGHGLRERVPSLGVGLVTEIFGSAVTSSFEARLSIWLGG